MRWSGLLSITMYFYSRPCGRGDYLALEAEATQIIISTHAPAGGATADTLFRELYAQHFYSRPCGRGDEAGRGNKYALRYFYSRPCGRGDGRSTESSRGSSTFLLTPLREGRRGRVRLTFLSRKNFYSRPCGRGDWRYVEEETWNDYFYSRPCGRGDPPQTSRRAAPAYFYSRPCGRGDMNCGFRSIDQRLFLLTPLREGRHAAAPGAPRSFPHFYSRPCGRGDCFWIGRFWEYVISTHAPAGGATAIFHKSVMRFCGKLPKDDTVLCLASFGFPRRDPKAVYLA